MSKYFDFEKPVENINNKISSKLINFDYKINAGWTKYPLRKGGSDHKVLPTEIAWRKNKIGFEAPSKIWLSKKEKNIKFLEKTI